LYRLSFDEYYLDKYCTDNAIGTRNILKTLASTFQLYFSKILSKTFKYLYLLRRKALYFKLAVQLDNFEKNKKKQKINKYCKNKSKI